MCTNALSIRSLNGSIYIQTDVNMTCALTVLDTTCLGGFTQPATGESVGPTGYKTLVHPGKGSIPIINLFSLFVVTLLLVISYHGIYTAFMLFLKQMSLNRNNDN